MNALERFVWDPDDLDWKNPSEKSGARRHSYRNLEKTLADLARKPQRTLRLVPQPLDALPNQENDERFETDWTEAKRVTKILAALFALSAAQEPISQEVRDKLGITDTDITAIANKLGKERAAEVMGLMWTPEGDLVQDPDAEKAITTTTENQVNEAVDAAVAAKLAPGDTWAPGQGPNDTPAADETTADEQLALDIAALFAFSAMRPDVVADMETGMLQNQLALTAYAAAGVSEVLVSDGTENDAPCILANGATWSIDYAMNNLKEHPACVRTFLPLGTDGMPLSALRVRQLLRDVGVLRLAASDGEARDASGKWTSDGGLNIAVAESKFPRVGVTVDGRDVGEHVPNTDSIAAGYNSSDEYHVLPGVREVPMSEFGDNLKPSNMFYAKNDIERTTALAGAIKDSGRIDPLIVVIDQKGPYILEGAHRAAALQTIGAKSFPALVVVETPRPSGRDLMNTKRGVK